jgi:hypothetical protein
MGINLNLHSALSTLYSAIKMDAEEMLRQQLKEEGDFATINILNDTANEALQMGLIIGHGYHGEKYEILHKSEVVLLSPKEAQAYLQNLIDESEGDC